MSSSSGILQALKGGSASTATGPAAAGTDPAAKRRGSQTGPLFSGLMNQKRNSTDAAAQARRQSFNEQKPEPGFIGKMWNNFTTGDK